MDDDSLTDQCRVCRCEGTDEKPLFYPCICTGSIKYIHQDCLTQWLRYSEKDYCELCEHKFSFAPIYSPDMPKHLPTRELLAVVAKSVITAIRSSLHYTLVLAAWLIFIPMSSYRFYAYFFGSNDKTFSWYFWMPDNAIEMALGFGLIVSTLGTFVFLLWLREQMIRVGLPEWVENPQYGQIVHIWPKIKFIFCKRNVEPQPAAEEQQRQAEGNRYNLRILQQDELLDDSDDTDDSDYVEESDEEENHTLTSDDGLDDGSDVDTDLDTDHDDYSDHDDDDVDVDEGINAAPVPAVPGALQEWNVVIDWEHPDNLTWRRILGFDGTFAFLENIFWLITLNFASMMLFAYLPYNIGNFVVKRVQRVDPMISKQFDRFIALLFGYVLIGTLLLVFHLVLSLRDITETRRRARKLIGISFLVVKVALLFTLEMLIFPTLVGVCLDLSALPLFGVKVQSRLAVFFSSPTSFVFIHWLMGVVSVFYFISFLFLVSEVLRPKLFWFLRDLQNPEYNPVNDMVHLPVFDHLLRCANSLLIFATVFGCLVNLPLNFIMTIIPHSLNSAYANIPNKTIFSLVSIFDLMIMLSMLRAIFPVADEHNNQVQVFTRKLIRYWLLGVGYVLDMKSYLLGDDADLDPEANPLVPEGGNAAALNNNDDTVYKPPHFKLRAALVVAFVAITLFLFGVLILTVPILVGYLMLLSFKDNMLEIPVNVVSAIYFGLLAILEIYYIRIRQMVEVVRSPFQNFSIRNLAFQAKENLIIVYNLIVMTTFVGTVPFMVGTLFDVVFLMPFRVPLNQTPVLYYVQDWVIGCFLLNVSYPMLMMANWPIRRHLEIFHDMDLRHMNFRVLIFNIVLPPVSIFGLLLLVPVLACDMILPQLDITEEMEIFIYRRIHPGLFVLFGALWFIVYQIRKVANIYEHIRNDKYLVGRRLINYDSKVRARASTPPVTTTTTTTSQ